MEVVKYLDTSLIQKYHFLKYTGMSFYEVTQIDLEPPHIFFFLKYLTNTIAKDIQSFSQNEQGII